jgi:hypothetical protein
MTLLIHSLPGYGCQVFTLTYKESTDARQPKILLLAYDSV